MFDFLVGNDFLSSVLAFALVLIPAVIIHELGHLFAAKAVGITILEFGVGYPPRLFRLFRWGETDFTFNLIPLGGFVRPFGEDMIRPQTVEEVARERALLSEAEREVRDSDERKQLSDRERLIRLGITNPRTVNDAKPLGRIFFMAAGAITNVIGAFIVFVIIGLTGVENIAGTAVWVTHVEPNSVLAQAGLQSGDVIETINGQAFNGHEALFQALNTDQPVMFAVLRPSAPPTVEGGSEEITVTKHDITVTPGVATENQLAYTQQLVILGYQLDSPAQAGGIQPGDILLSADGQSLRQMDAFDVLKQVNQANQGREYTLKVERNNETVSLQVTPRVNPLPSQGFLGADVRIVNLSNHWGLAAINSQQVMAYTPLGFGEAIQYGFNEVGTVLQMIAQMPARLLSGQAEPEESRVVSIVGISQLGGVLLQGSIEVGNLYPFLRFAALISIALGITNLLPIPPLDGGRILFVLIEIVRGKPLSQRIEDAIMMTGILLMLALGIFFIINDIRDPIINMLR
jgi:regulator of sigma E protease